MARWNVKMEVNEHSNYVSSSHKIIDQIFWNDTFTRNSLLGSHPALSNNNENNTLLRQLMTKMADDDDLMMVMATTTTAVLTGWHWSCTPLTTPFGVHCDLWFCDIFAGIETVAYKSFWDLEGGKGWMATNPVGFKSIQSSTVIGVVRFWKEDERVVGAGWNCFRCTGWLELANYSVCATRNPRTKELLLLLVICCTLPLGLRFEFKLNIFHSALCLVRKQVWMIWMRQVASGTNCSYGKKNRKFEKDWFLKVKVEMMIVKLCLDELEVQHSS